MLGLILVLIVIGVLLWAVNAYIPMDAKIKQILNIVVVICVIVYVLSAFGLFNHIHDVGVPQVR
jgi:hypothetical protein